MRNVDDGEEKKRKEEEKNGVFSGHYVIASSLPPEWQRPNDDRWNAARSCQHQIGTDIGISEAIAQIGQLLLLSVQNPELLG